MGLLSGAHAAADERQHKDQAANPQVEGHHKVIVHCPPEAFEGVGEGAGANVVVLGEHHSAGNNGEDELEHAGDEGAVDRTDPPSVSPGADEHEECVEGDDTEGGAHEDSDDGELGSSLLAIHVTVVVEVDEGLAEVSGQVLVGPVDSTTDNEINIPGIGSVSRVAGVDGEGLTARSARGSLPVDLIGSSRVLGRGQLVVSIRSVVVFAGGAIVVVGTDVPISPVGAEYFIVGISDVELR